MREFVHRPITHTMRKSVWIFLLAVILPSTVLGWLALRSAEQQKIILERQTAELYQHETENLAAAVRARIDEQRRGFAEAVRSLLEGDQSAVVGKEFAARLPSVWSRKAVGFSLDDEGHLLSPSPQAARDRTEWQGLIREHGGFLWGSAPATVYNVPVDDLTQPEFLRRQKLSASNTLNLSQSVLGAPQGDVKSRAVPRKDMEEKAAYATANAPAKSTAEKRMEPAPKSAPLPAIELKVPAESKEGKSSSDQLAKKKVVTTKAPTFIGSDSKSFPVPTAAVPPPAPAPMPSAPAAAPAPDFKLDAGKPATTAPKPASRAAPIPETSKLANLDKSESFRDSGTSNSGSIRLVQPQQVIEQQQTVLLSNLSPETAEFRSITAGQNEGLLTRFVQDKLTLIFWLRPAQAPQMIFGCVLDVADLADLWPSIMPDSPRGFRREADYVMVLLDDRARPVATSSRSPAAREWKRPFVASEIGEALPHWEAALYLMRPEQLQETASGLRRTLVFLVGAMLGAIALGGWLVVADARRQLALAQQKTDFVSNVSHELKTPLTSIRMFAELMLGGRAETQAKSPQYLRIIMVEAERLTRLINNVLDFAKLERKQKRFEKRPFDLHQTIEQLWEANELHLRENGFTTKWQAAPAPYPVLGDEDAIVQIVVNLLSNAEKYSAEQKEIELLTYVDKGSIHVSVLDRGLGVPSGSERKIFDAFYRAHDSLSSGIQGSGLGLTLAQRLAREHDGDIEYRPREGGGSAFTLRLPLVASSAQSPDL